MVDQGLRKWCQEYTGTGQQKDKELRDIIQFFERCKAAKRISCQSSCFAIVNGILDPKHDHHKRCVVPNYLRNWILEESHSSPMAGYFAGEKLYKSLVTHWW